jgi:hypothetical protein
MCPLSYLCNQSMAVGAFPYLLTKYSKRKLRIRQQVSSEIQTTPSHMNNLDLGRISLWIEFYSVLQMKSYTHICGIACELGKLYIS